MRTIPVGAFEELAPPAVRKFSEFYLNYQKVSNEYIQRVIQALSCSLFHTSVCAGGAHRAGWLCLIGTYQPAVQLWQLTAAGFLLLGSVDVGDTSPRLSPSLPDPLGGEEGSQPSHHVPESVQLLPQAQDEGVQVSSTGIVTPGTAACSLACMAPLQLAALPP